jgi:steroid 5-alpha reductase family enzyme
MVTLLATACAISAAAMATLWMWQRRDRDGASVAALWPALVGGLAVLYAATGDGTWARRSAIGWMMGSWGARLAIQEFYVRAAAGAAGERDRQHPWWMFLLLAAGAVVASAPALLASLNRDPELSAVELSACALWVIGFTGETTADRQRLRFRSSARDPRAESRTGLWRYSASIDRVFEACMWCAYVIFGIVAAA